MSLAKKFKTNTTAANDGVWFDYAEMPNEDGTIPGFRLARKSSQNKAYTRAMRDFSKDHANEDGELDISTLSEEDAEKLELETFVNTLLLDWRNFQPDDNGEVLEYSKENARSLFSDTDWVDLMRDLAKKCSRASGFKSAQLTGEAGN